MKVIQINTVLDGCTGRIALDIKTLLEENGHECLMAYGRGKKVDNSYRISNTLDTYFHGIMTRLFDSTGLHSSMVTKKFINMLEDYKPDIVHVHLLHGYYINYKMLFDYFKKNNIRVFWTMHDCWAFTGHCPYYTYVQCYKWKEYCHDCVQKKQHPKSYFVDRSRRNFEDKKNAFTGVSNMTIITPSNWLKEEIQKSFLNEYNITVIPNGVDLSIFHPTDNYFRKKHGLNDKIIILGVANVWSESKGIAYFYQLANKICDDRFQIVMVGLSKKQKKQIHSGIIGIERTKNIEMLADIYSSSDIFLNPTMADNFPTTNLEALACGTPIITFKTGGSPEALDNTCGMVIESDINAIMHTCKTMGRKNEQTIKNCVNRAKRFDKKICYIDYLKLYERDMH